MSKLNEVYGAEIVISVSDNNKLRASIEKVLNSIHSVKSMATTHLVIDQLMSPENLERTCLYE